MSTIICTLFEKNYHYGVGALINSLYENGFRGDFYAGYIGILPSWVLNGHESSNSLGLKEDVLHINRDLKIHFIKLSTEYHLANYKPDFMRKLIAGPAKNADNIFYFDPDIVVVRKWRIFEEWVQCGVLVCEDVNSPLQENHIRRIAWRNFFQPKGLKLSFKNSIYVNSGFIGVRKTQFDFLDTWIDVQNKISPVIGGLNYAPFAGQSMLAKEMADDYAPFSKTDQDALNIAIQAYGGDISFIGQEGMGFKPGPRLMSHALGKPKSWDWGFLNQFMKGVPPRMTEKDFWTMVSYPIKLYPTYVIKFKKCMIRIYTLLGRFYKK